MKKNSIWRKLNTYGIYAITCVVLFTLGYSIALL